MPLGRMRPLCLRRQLAEPDYDRDRRSNSGRCAVQSGLRECPGFGDDLDYEPVFVWVYVFNAYGSQVDKMKKTKTSVFFMWFVFISGMVYFFLPLYATFDFSLRMLKDRLSFEAYKAVFNDPGFYYEFWL